MAQAFQWWSAQFAVNPGRSLSNGERPLNYRDVLLVADAAGAGPELLTFLHLVGSYEESLGLLADDFGTDRGPVRLLEVPLRRVDAAMRVRLLRRFFAREALHIDGGGVLSAEHHGLLTNAWRGGCAELSASQRDEVRAGAPSELLPDLVACP